MSSPLSRDEFTKAAVDALREAKESENELDARKVATKFCYDFPDVTEDECKALAVALVDEEWRLQGRFPHRSVHGIVEMASKRQTNVSSLSAALGVRVVRALLEENSRSRVMRFASSALAPPSEAKKPDKKDSNSSKRSFDYSKWDALDSDTDDERPVEGKGSEPIETEDRTATKPCASAGDAAVFVHLCTEAAEFAMISQIEDWRQVVDDAAWIALAMRGDRKGGWILSKQGDKFVDDLCVRGYERYVFLLRDIALNRPKSGAIEQLASLCKQTGGGHARSAKDGGVALVALGSVAASIDTAGSRRDVRDAAVDVLPCVAELVRGLAAGKGEGDSALLGASLSLLEASVCIRTDLVDLTLWTISSFTPGHRAPLIESGALGPFCALVARLAAESASASSDSPRAKEAEYRLHRCLVNAVAQQDSQERVDFVLRVRDFVETVLDPAFSKRCPQEAALWMTRLAVVKPKDPRFAPAKLLNDDNVLAQVASHLNTTRSATEAWLKQADAVNLIFWESKDRLLRQQQKQKQEEDFATMPPLSAASDENSDTKVEEEYQEEAEKKAQRAAAQAALTERRLSRLRRELKLLPLAPRSSAHGDAASTAPRLVGGKVD